MVTLLPPILSLIPEIPFTKATSEIYPISRQNTYKKVWFKIYQILKTLNSPLYLPVFKSASITLCRWHLCADAAAKTLTGDYPYWPGLKFESYADKIGALRVVYADRWGNPEKRAELRRMVESGDALKDRTTARQVLLDGARINALDCMGECREKFWKWFWDVESYRGGAGVVVLASIEGFRDEMIPVVVREMWYGRYWDEVVGFVNGMSGSGIEGAEEVAVEVVKGLMPRYDDFGELVKNFERLSWRFDEILDAGIRNKFEVMLAEAIAHKKLPDYVIMMRDDYIERPFEGLRPRFADKI
jgi:hypothetical protein